MNILDNKFIKEYKEILMRNVPFNYPGLRLDEIEEAIDYSIKKRFTDHDVSIYNNYKNKEYQFKLSQLMQFIMDKRPIMTPYGVMFTRHGDVPNPLTEMIDSFLDIRKAFKKEMFKYPKGTEEFNKYYLLQIVAKRDVNSIYGACGQAQSLFYNIFCAAGITSAGRGCISASILFFEAFMANNVKFGSLNEIIQFIDNVRNEAPNRTNTDHLYRQISVEECFYKIMSTCGYLWLPTEREMEIVWEIISKLPQQDLNRLYYKNNLYAFCDNPYVQDIIVRMIRNLRMPFLNPNETPEEIKDDLELFVSILKEYVYYGYMTIDKLDRVNSMIRESVMVVDTDSCMVTFNPWYQYVTELVKDLDFPVKHKFIEIVKKIKKDEFGDSDLVQVVHKIDPEYDYDFKNEEILELQRSVSPAYVIPQDGLRHSIINILAYCTSTLIVDFFVEYSKHYNSYVDGRKCRLNMKNEFLFKALMLTNGRKNYASYIEVQEGNLVPENAALNISGMPLDKVNIPKDTSNALKRIIKDKILNIEDIDQLAVLRELSVLEKRIYDSLLNGDTKYYKPLRVKAQGAYKLPMSNEGIKGIMAYNALKRDTDEAINPDTSNSILIIKTLITKTTVNRVKDDDPETYNKIMKLLGTEAFKTEIKSIAIPTNIAVPEWIKPFIDYSEIVHNNLNNFPLESIGIHRYGNKNITISNVLQL